VSRQRRVIPSPGNGYLVRIWPQKLPLSLRRRIYDTYQSRNLDCGRL
jgi:hypothetical protein